MSNNKTSPTKAKRTLSRLGFRSHFDPLLSLQVRVSLVRVLWFKLFKHILKEAWQDEEIFLPPQKSSQLLSLTHCATSTYFVKKNIVDEKITRLGWLHFYILGRVDFWQKWKFNIVCSMVLHMKSCIFCKLHNAATFL